MAVPPHIHDVLVVGTTPAGAAAALRACRANLSCLVGSSVGADRQPELAWLGPAGISLCQQCGLDARRIGAATFKGLKLHSWDLRRNAEVAGDDLHGWIVDRATLCSALMELAQSSGAELLPQVALQEVVLGEQFVSLRWKGGEARGRILLIADGPDSPTAALARMTAAGQCEGMSHCAWVTLPASATAKVGLEVAIGGRRCPQSVTLLRRGGRLQVLLVTPDATMPVGVQLNEFLVAARAGGLIPGGPAPEPAVGRTPAGLALDMETLVGKRCLLIGEAGGFVSAFSNESIYPGMRSGWIAAEFAAAALQAPVLQDALLEFSEAWRAGLASHLRMPNTDLGLLMPLIFGNAQMAGRLARAFLLGQSF